MKYIRENRPALLLVGVVGLLVFCVAIGTLVVANMQAWGPPVTTSDFKISLTRSACFGFCPAYTVELNANGGAVFKGEAYTTVDGQTINYDVDPANVQLIRNKVERMNFFSLKDRYENPYITDIPSQEITVTLDGKTKSIYMYGLGKDVPKELDDLANLIDKIAMASTYTTNAVDLPLYPDESTE